MMPAEKHLVRTIARLLPDYEPPPPIMSGALYACGTAVILVGVAVAIGECFHSPHAAAPVQVFPLFAAVAASGRWGRGVTIATLVGGLAILGAIEVAQGFRAWPWYAGYALTLAFVAAVPMLWRQPPRRTLRKIVSIKARAALSSVMGKPAASLSAKTS
jgi:hypothetical protein